MRGDTLIEVLVALAIVVVAVSAITTLGITSLNNAKFVAGEEQATKYAQEGMETIRKIRNGNYSAFAGYAGSYCLAKDATTLGPSCSAPNIDNIYIRSVQISQNDLVRCGNNLAHTIVRVAWTDGKCAAGAYCHSTEQSSCLSTVSPIQGP